MADRSVTQLVFTTLDRDAERQERSGGCCVARRGRGRFVHTTLGRDADRPERAGGRVARRARGRLVRRLRAVLPLSFCALLASTPPSVAFAEEAAAPASDTPRAIFERGAAALERGEYAAAIDAFEALADRGFSHPDASFDRGVAYLLRLQARADKPGDLGRAAAAFEEALRLRPDDGEAERALDLVRAEVTRRRARRAKDAVDVRPTLDRVVVNLASETTWAALAVASSVLLAAGLVLRRRPAGPAHVAGSVMAPAAALALCVLVPLTWGARTLRLTTRPAVVIAPEVYLADEAGRSLGGDPIPEAASVEASARRDGMVRVRWGPREGWVPASSIRLLAPQ